MKREANSADPLCAEAPWVLEAGGTGAAVSSSAETF